MRRMPDRLELTLQFLPLPFTKAYSLRLRAPAYNVNLALALNLVWAVGLMFWTPMKKSAGGGYLILWLFIHIAILRIEDNARLSLMGLTWEKIWLRTIARLSRRDEETGEEADLPQWNNGALDQRRKRRGGADVEDMCGVIPRSRGPGRAGVHVTRARARGQRSRGQSERDVEDGEATDGGGVRWAASGRCGGAGKGRRRVAGQRAAGAGCDWGGVDVRGSDGRGRWVVGAGRVRWAAWGRCSGGQARNDWGTVAWWRGPDGDDGNGRGCMDGREDDWESGSCPTAATAAVTGGAMTGSVRIAGGTIGER
ncbi:hypothetical protein B0H16DRAFT_1465429 [Mycena metata]|uniref:Uncharacterized protein n=1 Tax=Mycena metata TaxID=1033252 RepID=A0AAD7MZL2_9AGAR|nr:hypothetical protein B0H16DRAFT_1465429 [Mycena metata]